MMAREQISDPTAGQSEKTIGRYLAQCQVGSEIAIRETYGGRLSFTLTTISAITAKGRVWTADTSYAGNTWWRRTGRSTWYPKGQAHLVEPTEAIRAYVKEHPDGVPFMWGSIDLHGTD